MTHGAPSKKKSDNADDDVIPPPDGGWGWMVVFGSFMIHIVADGITYSFGIFMVEFIAFYGVSTESASWVLSILVGVTLGSGPIASSMVNKYGCRPVTVVGAIIAGIGLGVSIFAPTIEVLYLTVGLLAGFGFGMMYLPAIVSVTCYFEKKRSFATGIAVCGSGLGTFIFAPLTQTLIDSYRLDSLPAESEDSEMPRTWQGGLLIIAIITMNCILFGALFRPIERPKKSRQLDEIEDVPEKDKLMAIREETQSRGEEETMHNGSDSMNRRSVHGDTLSVAQENSKNTLSVGDLNSRQMTRSQPQLLQVPVDALAGDYRKFGSHGNLPKPSASRKDSATLENGASRASSKPGSRKSSTADMTGSGVMYRKDALYSGSVVNLPEYKENPTGFAGSMRRLPAIDDVSDDQNNDDEDGKSTKVCGCIPCSPESYHAYKEMMDFSLLTDPIFVLFTISNFCTSIGFNVPYVYMKDKALDLNIEDSDASMLIAIIGLANTIGRIILGYVSDKPWINRLWLYNSALTICGIATALSAFCLDYYSLAVYAAVFGATIGAYVGLTSVVLVDLLGLDKLTNAFGLLLLFQGIASFVGPPIAGRLRDVTGSYDAGFYVAGFMIAISGVMLFAIPFVQRCVAAKTKRKAGSQGKEMAVMENGGEDH